MIGWASRYAPVLMRLRMVKSSFLESLETEARDWSDRGLMRHRKSIQTPVGSRIQMPGKEEPSLSFLSNDYLGLAAHPVLREAVANSAQRWGAGSASSPLVSGHLACHADAEMALAAFTGFEQALLFITGYMANLAVVTSLLTSPEDVVFSDSLNHASLIDACRLSRAQIQRYAHLNMTDLAGLLQNTPARRRLIVTDAVFSMDGDCAPLSCLLRLAEEYDALILVDDAHGFGVRGPHGMGSVSEEAAHSERLILMATLGKAAGLSGAFIAASALLIEYFVQHARTYIFSTSPSPALAGAIPAALNLIQESELRRKHLRDLGKYFALGSDKWRYPPQFSGTPIIPVVVGGERETMRFAESFARAGVWLAGIRPPTVPSGTSRLRISLSAAHTFNDIDMLLDVAGSLGFDEQ